MNVVRGIRRAYIAMMQAINANWCVEKKTLKSEAPFALDWCPGKEKELDAIKSLRLKEKDLKERFWSLETRIELLKQGNYALVEDISTQEELNEILVNAKRCLVDGASSDIDWDDEKSPITMDILIKGMRKRTPSVDALKQLINVLNRDALIELGQKFPKCLNDVKAFEVLGLLSEHNVNTFVPEKRWDLAVLLCKHTPKKALDYLQILLQIPLGKFPDEGVGIFKSFFDIALENKLDMSPYICRMYQEFPEQYVALRRSQATSPFVGSYLNQMWRIIYSNFNQSMKMPSLTWSNDSMKREDEVEAYFWIKIAMANLSDVKVMKIMVGQLDFLKEKLNENNFFFLTTMMASFFHYCGEGVKLMKYVEDSDTIHSIRERMLKVSAPCELATLYPFVGWTKRQIELACRKLIEADSFPVEKIGELDESVQAFAREVMLSRAQILVLERYTTEEWIRLFDEGDITADAECRMLSMDQFFAKVKIDYIRQYGLKLKAFNFLLEFKNLDYEIGYKYLLAYAEKCGLTEEQHLQVMQSIYAKRAPYLMKYVNTKSQVEVA
jgi:hypothetical protein